MRSNHQMNVLEKFSGSCVCEMWTVTCIWLWNTSLKPLPCYFVTGLFNNSLISRELDPNSGLGIGLYLGDVPEKMLIWSFRAILRNASLLPLYCYSILGSRLGGQDHWGDVDSGSQQPWGTKILKISSHHYGKKRYKYNFMYCYSSFLFSLLKKFLISLS